MGFLKQIDIDEFKGKLTSDLSKLGKLYKAKKLKHQVLSVDHTIVNDYLHKGWEIEKQLKTKTRIIKPKNHSKQFEDDIWCQFYELGYRHLNYDENFQLPFGTMVEEKKQIDVIAIDHETIFIIECKSAKKLQKAPSYKDEFDVLSYRIEGFRKSIHQAFGKDLKIKFIFATRNLRIDKDSIDVQRLLTTKSFLYTDNTYHYINNLIKNYKKAARYQFLGLVLKNEKINNSEIKVPAIEGFMGEKHYFMFSLEPALLLKMGFILHRTKANEEETPTYQRLLVPSRLKGITNFIDEGGYFPNSIIINFNLKKVKFEASPRSSNSQSRFGNLCIPNTYASAYIIDGQHRLYGYANSEFSESNTIPVVAFVNLDPHEQLEIFMDINQNQKAVSPNLRLLLDEDLYWKSEIAMYRLKALKASIVRELSSSSKSVLYNKISIGEDSSLLKFKPFITALNDCGLLPKARGNKYISNLQAPLYDINNHNHDLEMRKSKINIIKLIQLCYEFVEDNYRNIYERKNYFIVSNRGTFAYISIIGCLNIFLTDSNHLNVKSSPSERFNQMKPYLDTLMKEIVSLSEEEQKRQFELLGAGADKKWYIFFLSLVNSKHSQFEPEILKDWKERQNKELLDEGRILGTEIEKHIKSIILKRLKLLFNENWELEINSIKRTCSELAEKEKEKNYKDGLGTKNIKWTEMLTIMNYKRIIEDYWTKSNENDVGDINNFEKIFAIDIGEKFNSKKDKTKWLSYFNSYRNIWAHAGTKETGLNSKEVSFIRTVHNHFFN